MKPERVSTGLRRVAAALESFEELPASLADDLRKILAAVEPPTPEDQLIADIHEDKSEQLRQIALQQLSDTEGLKKQLLASLNAELRNRRESDWNIEKDPDGWSAWMSVTVKANGVSIPITIDVGSNTTIRLGRPSYKSWDKSVEIDYLPTWVNGSGISEDEFDEFAEAYMSEYENFDWDPIFEWLASESDAESDGRDALYDASNDEPIYGYYDLRGRG